MPNQNIDILNSIYKNASMGTSAISKVLPKVNNPKMKQELKNQRNNYHTICQDVRNQIYDLNSEPQTISPVSKVYADLGITASTLTNNSPTHIAEMMIQGTNMGIIEIVKAINSYDSITPEMKNQADSILKREQQYIDNLKAFL